MIQEDDESYYLESEKKIHQEHDKIFKKILEYEYRIMSSAIDRKRIGQKEYKLPMVVSIVLYSGRKKWNAKTYIKEVQETLKGYKELEFARYNIVDINNFSEEELLKDRTFMSKAMLIEKTRYTDRLVEFLEKIILEMNKNGYEKEQKELLRTIIDLVLSRKMGQDVANMLINKLKEKGGREMLAVLEMIDEENKRIFERGERKGKKAGIKEGIEQVVRNMLNQNVDMEFIMKVTELEKEDVEKIACKIKKK